MDTELVIRAQRGDEEAFASLAVADGDRLHALWHRILGGGPGPGGQPFPPGLTTPALP